MQFAPTAFQFLLSALGDAAALATIEQLMMRKNGYPLNTSAGHIALVAGFVMGGGLVTAWRLQIRVITLPSVAPEPMKERLRVTVRAF